MTYKTRKMGGGKGPKIVFFLLNIFDSASYGVNFFQIEVIK